MATPERTQFHLMTPEERTQEASTRLLAGYQPTSWAQRLGPPALLFVVSMLAPATGIPALFLLGIVGGVAALPWLGVAVFTAPLNPRPDAGAIAALASRLSGSLRGACPACAREIVVTPDGTTFTVHCPGCGTPLRYDRGWMYRDPG